jgi:hypothetical protein
MPAACRNCAHAIAQSNNIDGQITYISESARPVSQLTGLIPPPAFDPSDRCQGTRMMHSGRNRDYSVAQSLYVYWGEAVY